MGESHGSPPLPLVNEAASDMMNGALAIARILKQEGIDFVSCYPLNLILEGLSLEGVRPIVTRQERVAGNIADGVSRMSNGRRIGVFLVQESAGAENAFSGVAQAWTDSSPILCLPGHPGRAMVGVSPHFDSVRNYSGVTKLAEKIPFARNIPDRMRRAFTALRTGRPGPVLLEVPRDVMDEPFEGELEYTPVPRVISAADPDAVRDAARTLCQARRPLILAGQGVLYAEASAELRTVAQMAATPVVTTLLGKSAFPENHPLALGPAAYASTEPAARFIEKADLILAVGTSLSATLLSPRIQQKKRFIHATIDPRDINKEYVAEVPVIADAKLFLAQLVEELKRHIHEQEPAAKQAIELEIRQSKQAWLARYRSKFESDQVPLNPYRIIGEFIRAIDPAQTVVTHDSGGPRDHLSPFYESVTPRGYLGWGHSTQLGFSLGLAMGAKLVAPEKLVVNFMGDGSIGMVGMDLETAARAEIPILTIVMNNGLLGNYERYLPISAEKHGIKKMTGNYADLASALGVHAERVDRPEAIAPAFQRSIQRVRDGQPVLLEMISAEESMISGQEG